MTLMNSRTADINGNPKKINWRERVFRFSIEKGGKLI